MTHTEAHLRIQSLAYLHDIQGWVVGEHLRQLKHELEEYEMVKAVENNDEKENIRYVWHTQEDSRVRVSHAANNKRIFSQKNPPNTGHPGEDFGCRCWAEPVDADEYVRQTLLTVINDTPSKWGFFDFANHYYFGEGAGKTLQEIGYLEAVIKHYSETLGAYNRVNSQIIDAAKAAGEGSFIYDFRGTYEFGEIVYELAGSKVSGIFIGDVRREGEFLVVSGIVTYDFFDDFADPYQIIEGTQYIFGLTRAEAIDWLQNKLGIDVDFSGVVFSIIDRWQTRFNASVRLAKK